ncbi:MAG: glycoside hydrolase family 95-like protein, partial [Bacteroidota bacterium]
YHTNINIQMSYWPAELTNLSELHMPYFDLLTSLVEPGTKTARAHYGADGWVVHTITNAWGFTSPGELPRWGLYVTGGAWMCSHIWERYLFTNDEEFLRKMYPVIKGSVSFYLDWLTEDQETGKLISGPTNSPENSFIASDGKVYQLCMSPAHDNQVLWELFDDFIKISNELGIKGQLFNEVAEAQKRIPPMQIGSDGRLMEWAEEFPEPEKGHRHISHLYALHPGEQITPDKTPLLAEAVKKSLDYRQSHGAGQTGWSAAWFISMNARLGRGEEAKKSLDFVLANATCPNLFGIFPPFQTDGNYGTTAGIAEMLIQSHSNEIHLLPALPSTWPDGQVTGLCARGGFEVDLKWAKGKLKKVSILSKDGKKTNLRYLDNIKTLDIESGEKIEFDW